MFFKWKQYRLSNNTVSHAAVLIWKTLTALSCRYIWHLDWTSSRVGCVLVQLCFQLSPACLSGLPPIPRRFDMQGIIEPQQHTPTVYKNTCTYGTKYFTHTLICIKIQIYVKNTKYFTSTFIYIYCSYPHYRLLRYMYTHIYACTPVFSHELQLSHVDQAETTLFASPLDCLVWTTSRPLWRSRRSTTNTHSICSILECVLHLVHICVLSSYYMLDFFPN